MSLSEANLEQMLHYIYADMPSTISTTFWSLIAFLFIAAVFFLFFDTQKGGPSDFDIRAKIFPGALYRHPTNRVDFWNYVMRFFMWTPIFAALGNALTLIIVQNKLEKHFGTRAALLTDNLFVIPIEFIIIILSTEFGSYVLHLALHKIPILWSFHRAHHSAEALTLLTIARDHPMDNLLGHTIVPIIGGAISSILFYFLGFDKHPAALAAIATYYLTGTCWAMLNHSHIWMSFGPLNYIISAPIMHQIHHSAEERHRDKNLGASLMVFDWLFGTIYSPKEREEYRWGLNDEEIGDNNPHIRLRSFYFEPFIHCWHTIVRPFSAPPRQVSTGPASPSDHQ